MSRNRREHGRIISVETHTRGDALAEDAAAGATSITVEDAGDFDEDGGWLTIGGQVVEFSECDDDTGIILLVDPLTAAAEQGDPVQVWSNLYDEVIEYQQALVELDGEYDNPDPVAAEVAEGVGDLPEGDRGKAGESCTLKRVADDEWEIVGVGGRSAKSRGVRFEADDPYVLTTADIAAGTATVPLSHRPCDEGLVAWWRTTPQRPTNYTINYDAQTITWPLSGFEAAGDRIWVHYAYRKGVSTPLATGTPRYVGVTMFSPVTSTVTSVALPAGTEAGDLLILAETDWDSAACSDPRMTLRTTFPGQFRSLGNVWTGIADGSGSPIAVNFSGASSRVSGALVALRSARIDTSPAALTSVAPGAAASGITPTVADSRFTLAIALLRNGSLSTGQIGHNSGSYGVEGFVNGGLKTCAIVAVWDNTTVGRTTSPADTFTFSGSIDAWALAVYKIEGAT